MMRRALSSLAGLSATALVVLAPAIALAEEGAAHAAEHGADHSGGVMEVFPMAYWGAVVLVPLITFGICALVANKGTVEPLKH